MYAMDSSEHRRSRRERVRHVLSLVELDGSEHLYPPQISGGMAKRCSLARAVLAPHDVMLLDEPLSSLDKDLRSRLLERLKDLLKGVTTVIVTHDDQVVSSFADQVYQIVEGRGCLEAVDREHLEPILRYLDHDSSESDG